MSSTHSRPAGLTARTGGDLSDPFVDLDERALAALAHVGDPLADAVVDDGVLPRTIIASLRGRHPSGFVEGPVAELHAQLTTVPDWVDDERLHRGSLAYLGIGATWMQLLLGPGSLVNTYRSPAIAAVLATGGRLNTAAAARRISETGAWLGSAVQPGHLGIGAPGHVATVQVRLLHAHVRHHVSSGSDWDLRTHGVPINQVSLARTLLDFTSVPMNALSPARSRTHRHSAR